MGWPLAFEICRCGSMLRIENIWPCHLSSDNNSLSDTWREKYKGKNKGRKGRRWYIWVFKVRAMKIEMKGHPPKFPPTCLGDPHFQVVRAASLFFCSLSNLIYFPWRLFFILKNLLEVSKTWILIYLSAFNTFSCSDFDNTNTLDRDLQVLLLSQQLFVKCKFCPWLYA